MEDVIADNVSLSPNLISCNRNLINVFIEKKFLGERTLTDTVSFSFTIGTTPIDSSSLKVLTAFRYRVRCRRGTVVSVSTPLPQHVLDTHPICPHASEAPAQWAAPAAQTNYPIMQSSDLARWLPTPVSHEHSFIGSHLNIIFPHLLPRQTFWPTSQLHALQPHCNRT